MMTLYTHHQQYLTVRGITDPQVIAERGYYSSDQGLHIPIWGLTERRIIGEEVRLDTPKGEQKFDRPKGQGNRLNVAPNAIDKVRDASEPLFVVEGTTRADALAQRGMAACSITGVWGWKGKEHGALNEWHDLPMHGRTVIFGPDADAWSKPQVNKAVREFVIFAERKGAKVMVLKLPEGQGIDDYLAAGNSPHSLYNRMVPGKDVPEVIAPKASDYIAMDDLSLARRWAKEHPHAKYLTDVGEWVVWDGKKWVEDTKTGALARQSILKTVVGVVDDLYNSASNSKDKAEAAKHKLILQSTGKIHNIRSMAETLHEVQSSEDAFDASPYYINLANGTLDLRTQELMLHEPHRYQRSISRTVWDVHQSGARWQQFLDEILPEDVQNWVQAYLGASLVAGTAEQVLPIMQGSGANGKSVLMGVIQAVLGTDYSAPIDKKLLLANKREDHQTNLMSLKGKRLVIASETDAGDKLALASVKQLTGGDTITARGIGKDQTSFRPTHNLVMLTNSRPEIDGADKAIWRRLKIVPFSRVIPEDKQDRGLERYLIEEEGSAILRWLVDGFAVWFGAGKRLPECHTINIATLGYQMDENSFSAFAYEMLVVDAEARTPKSEVSKAWKDWQSRNWDAKDLTAREFNQAMINAGYVEKVAKVSGKATKVWSGVRLSGEDNEKVTGLPKLPVKLPNSEENGNHVLAGQSPKIGKVTEVTTFGRGSSIEKKNTTLSNGPQPPQKPVTSVTSVTSQVRGGVVDHQVVTAPVTLVTQDLLTPSPILKGFAELLQHYARPLDSSALSKFQAAEDSTNRWDEVRNKIRAMYMVTALDLYDRAKDMDYQFPRDAEALVHHILNAREYLETTYGLIVRARRTDGPLDTYRPAGDPNRNMTIANTGLFVGVIV